jgi:hypothetical protein
VILKRSAPEPKLPLFPIFIRIIPLLNHSNNPCGYSIIPCGWHKPITLMHNGVPYEVRKLPLENILFSNAYYNIIPISAKQKCEAKE